MITVEKLREYGADVDEGLARCYGNEALYLRLVGMVPEEANFNKLKEALDANDMDAAFEAAHAIKGVLGNLSLTPLYYKASEMTELLRSKKDTDYSGHLKELFEMRDKLGSLCQ